MKAEIKELKIENVKTNDLYLAPGENERLTSTFVKSVDIPCQEFSFYGDNVSGVDTVDNPSGILVKKNGKGLEFYVGSEIMKALNLNFLLF